MIEDLKYTHEDIEWVTDYLRERRGGTQWNWHVEMCDYGNQLRVTLGVHIDGVLVRNIFPLADEQESVADLAKKFDTKKEWLPVFAEVAGTRLQTWADYKMGEKP